ncbi:MAG: PAS domain S-box protein [Deltaproteobacteria bacterium]|nr:PAS domain S-box protein [Deltaproteobacteria bacterium]
MSALDRALARIAELERQVASLQEEASLFGLFAADSPSMIFLLCDGGLAYANERCAEVTGYGAGELCAPGFDYLQLVAPESRPAVTAALARFAAGQDVPPYAMRAMARDGRLTDVLLVCRPFTLTGKRALRESETLYRALVETCPDAITVTDLQGKLLMTNRQAAALHGYGSAEEVLAAGLDAFAFIAPEDRERAFENARKVLETGRIAGVEYHVLTREDRKVPTEMSVSLIRDADGAPKAFIGVVRDLSERKEAEAEKERLSAQVLHAQKLESLGVLAGGIAHDFNNLLMGVLGNASILLAELGEGSPQRERLQKIESAAYRARDLTQQLLAYSGRGSRRRDAFDLNELIAEMRSLLGLSISKKIVLHSRLASDLPAVEGDATQLRQVIMNLITNASEAIGERTGTISLSTSEVGAEQIDRTAALVEGEIGAGRYLCLEVADTGCGMDERVRARLFEPFFTTKFAGRGLGLSAVRGIVRGHGGGIAVWSEPGAGTRVRVYLPASEKSATSDLPLPSKPPEPARGTVLVVDDERTVRDVAAAMLASAGYEILTAGDGPQGVELYAKHADGLSAVLLDATMPGMDGAQALREMRRIRPGVPVIVSSGYPESQIAQQLQPEAADHFIQKPYRIDELLGLLKRARAANC